MPRLIALDTETFFRTKGDNPCTVKVCGAWAYCRHPEFYCYLISVSDGEQSWAGAPEEFDWSSLEGAHLVSHNAYFDRAVVEYMMEIGQIPKFSWSKWECTSELTSYLCNRRSLKDAVMFLYGVDLSKAARENMAGKHWKDVKDTPEGQEFLKYADSDAIWCWRIANDYLHIWPEKTRRVALLQRDSGLRGVQVDVLKLEAYISEMSKVLFSIEAKLPWVAEGSAPTSPKRIAEKCREVGIPCTPVKKYAGEEAFLEWEKTYAPLYPWVNAVSQWRVANKFLDFLQTVKSRLDKDGVFHFSLRYFGAHTGRFSGEGGVNLQNLRKDPILIDRDGNVRTDDASTNEYWSLKDRKDKDDNPIPDESPAWLATTNWGLEEDGVPLPAEFEFAFDCRSLFVARDGYKLVMCDLSQIEPRVLAWLAGNEKMLEAIRDGFSVYEAAAVATGKYTGKKGDFKKLKDLYKVQKAQTLGCGYGCGWEKYITVAMTLAGYDVCKMDPTNEETGKPIFGYTARKDVKEFRQENPAIPELWNKFDQSFRDSLGETFYIELPSGRVMTYRNVARRPKKKVRKIIDEATGEVIRTEVKESFVYTAEIDGRRYEFYGGLLTENATQAASYDVFEEEILNVEDEVLTNIRKAGNNAYLLWTVHDEGIFEVPVATDKKQIERAMSMTPEWLPGCPIGSEAQEGYCYKK